MTEERDALAAVIDAAVPHDAVPSFRFTHAVKAADGVLRAGFRKAPAASEDVIKRAADVLSRRCGSEVTWAKDMDAARDLAKAGLLASHPVTDETVERVAKRLKDCDPNEARDWSELSWPLQGHYRSMAKSAIEALGGQR